MPGRGIEQERSISVDDLDVAAVCAAEHDVDADKVRTVGDVATERDSVSRQLGERAGNDPAALAVLQEHDGRVALSGGVGL